MAKRESLFDKAQSKHRFGGFWEGEQTSASPFVLAVVPVMSGLQDEQKFSSCFFSALEEVFSGEKASFPPPLALLGYVPIPTFCSYCVQTPISNETEVGSIKRIFGVCFNTCIIASIWSV